MAAVNTREIIKHTVVETLLQLGINVAEPHDVIEFQKDWHHLRASRKREEAISAKVVLTVIGALALGMVGLIVLAITGGNR